MIHPSALKKALKERKKRIFFLFPFPLLIGVLIFRPKDSLPNEPLSLLGKGKRLKAQCCALAESSRSTDAAKHSS